jgi:hypothetical protein
MKPKKSKKSNETNQNAAQPVRSLKEALSTTDKVGVVRIGHCWPPEFAIVVLAEEYDQPLVYRGFSSHDAAWDAIEAFSSFGRPVPELGDDAINYARRPGDIDCSERPAQEGVACSTNKENEMNKAKKNGTGDGQMPEHVSYFLANPEAEGARKYLRSHKREFLRQLIEKLHLFYLHTMHPPKSCEEIGAWERWMKRILDLYALGVVSVDQMSDIHVTARSDVYWGVVESSNEHPDEKGSKAFFALFPEFFGKQPTGDQIVRAGLRANARWERSDLCPEESPFGAELRQMREDAEITHPSAGPMPPEPRPEWLDKLLA